METAGPKHIARRTFLGAAAGLALTATGVAGRVGVPSARRAQAEPFVINMLGGIRNPNRRGSRGPLGGEGGGIVGIYFMPFLAADGMAVAEDVVRHIDHAVQVCGEEHVGIGTDGGTTAVDDLDAPPAAGSEWPALYDELEYFSERVGMPMVDVIRAATSHGALALGLAEEIGTVEEGKYANVVFLEDDPTAGVENLKSVLFTLKRGRRFDREDFELGAPPPR